ncbi:ABC transporter ATP-binding protein [Thalassoglobus polymorphus]|uniref:Putative ABC transporter ATP-binding protein YxlF n=1 Tax=Thalassoglobus polymorphus TaxID=2527994 RepID=A0A517QQL8_9PLAN|nr:ATP-binding cassette domain-containing protein [Thalassoglobus polymorphus]QDT33924.1 putative ABC transporter ATP-binding protein YxlF [Thalassoglobus polymorphus]
MVECSDPMIEAKSLSKFYGPFIATRDVSFSVPQGEIAAFLGPNGAGKSTTMKLLTGFLTPSEGEARIGGFNMAEDRIKASELIGYLPENGPLYNEMTPQGLLKYIGQARGMSRETLKQRLDYVVQKCSLEDVWGKQIGKLSRGYRQRVGMAHALLHDPQVLILDEPTSGLDPNQTFQVRELIRELGKTKTILLSTHILSEVEAVCDRIILIDRGRIILDGNVEQMKGETGQMEDQFRKLTGTNVAG